MKKYKQQFDELITVLEKWPDVSFMGLARILRMRLDNPEVYITLTGETSSGKTTLINSLLQEKLLAVGAKPTTGTVTQLRCINIADKEYYAIDRDGTEAQIDHDVFYDLSLQPDQDLLRLLLRFPNQQFQGMNLFDTPGFNSLTHGHREVLEEFLPESDMIIFVCGYRSGFGQNEQELLELIRKSVVLDPELPVILVVNRVPKRVKQGDKRIAEIMSNATDCLFKKPPVLLIFSKNPDLGLPDTSELWAMVNGVIQDPQRKNFVTQKINTLGLELAEEAHARIYEKWLSMGLSSDERDFLQDQLKEFSSIRIKAREYIQTFEDKLSRNLPKLIEQRIEQLKKDINSDIDAENKWLNKDSCIVFVQEHSLPMGVQSMSKSVEEYIFQELEKLNKKLEELVNTAIQKLENQAKLKGGNIEKLVESIANRLLQEMGGRAITSLLKGVGGVGGAAAGAGNLVKMAVSRLGKLFGKTFEREIYNNIGRFFNGKMVARLGLALQVFLEVVLYVRDARTWQRNLKEQVSKALDQWKEEVKQNLFDDVIKKCVDGNVQGIDQLLLEFEGDLQDKLRMDDGNVQKQELEDMISVLQKVQHNWRVA